MDDGETETRHINKKRKINGSEEDADHQCLDLSLTLRPFDPPPSPPPPPASSPVRPHISSSATLNSPATLSPRPPQYSPRDYWKIARDPRNSPIHYPRWRSPIYRHVYPTANRNFPVPFYRNFLPTTPIHPPILSPRSFLTPLSPFPSLSISRFFSPTVTRNSQEPSQESSGDRHGLSRPPRARRKTAQLPRGGKSLQIEPPYPWSTDRRCTVHSLQYLLSNKLNTITGQVQCKRCEKSYEMGFDLRQKLSEVFQFIIRNKNQMHDRAPSSWMNPTFPPCRFCKEENCARPIISDKKKTVNWLFLLLGQTLGCLMIDQLKYFCKHTMNHRTGAKDRVLYLTYMELCKQLDPNGPFDR
ncbi:hypothetical protein F511_06523 [Dorcoceras hygrometricum]|uniref:DUF7086 domain-containing protein n=1 Tax=Dorcoceras hygrometricum TaxID=472368 RepID=A0A2Z7D933_9LAMI|nr:hypothetical protein F511_06523 [Dorcoceras hygrometricum]